MNEDLMDALKLLKSLSRLLQMVDDEQNVA